MTACWPRDVLLHVVDFLDVGAVPWTGVCRAWGATLEDHQRGYVPPASEADMPRLVQDVLAHAGRARHRVVHVRPDRAAASLALLTLLAWATDWGRCESLRVCVRVDSDGGFWALHRNAELPMLASLVATLLMRCRRTAPACTRVEMRHGGAVRPGGGRGHHHPRRASSAPVLDCPC